MSMSELQLPDNLCIMIILNLLSYSYQPLIFIIMHITTANFTTNTIISRISTLFHYLEASPTEVNYVNMIQHAPYPICGH